MEETNFFTMTGYDLWAAINVKTMVVLRNAITGEEVTIEKGDERFKPAEIKIAADKIKAKKPAKTKPAVRNKWEPKIKYIKSEYKGVRGTPSGKFEAKYYDKENKTVVYIGLFKSELTAAAAVQEKMGNKKEAARLRAEYAEGDGLPEPKANIKVTGGGTPGDWLGA